MRILAAAAALAALASGAMAARQAGDAPITIDTLLQRAGAYVTEFEARLSSVVAEERYVQQTLRTRSITMSNPTMLRRELRSDFLLVKVPGAEGWMPFRDVFEVDGRPVRDRQDRLAELFLQPPAIAVDQAKKIADESARYNIPELVEIPAGPFVMGSAPPEKGRNADETSHEVSISRPFFLGKFEVTQHDWRTVMGTNPSHFADCGQTCPVENVSFVDVRQFLDRLNASTPNELVYRLPTEAEWEYACRAGATTPRRFPPARI